jgi:hypothetical protein
MATTDKVLIGINQNFPVTPDMAYQIYQAISTKFDVEAVVIPYPNISKPIQAISETLDESTLLQIEAESVVVMNTLLES